MNKRFNIFTFIICLLIAFIPGIVGSLAMTGEIDGSWYASIRPALTPPNWIFPIVWTILYILIGISLYSSWTISTSKIRFNLGLAFAINLIANGLWTFFYFGMHNITLAFIDIIIILLSIIWMMIITWKINKTSTYLLVPYLLWVSFAAYLNFASIY